MDAFVHTCITWTIMLVVIKRIFYLFFFMHMCLKIDLFCNYLQIIILDRLHLKKTLAVLRKDFFTFSGYGSYT